MKKKIYSMLLMISMVCGLCACGASAGEKAATVTIEEETYVLSGDFQEVVGSMVENDLQVRSIYNGGLNMPLFDEDGKISDEEVDMKNEFIYATERMALLEESIVQKMYMVDINADYESELGFNSDSEKMEIKELDGFMKCTAVRMIDNDTYVAMFVDDKQVDFSKYEEAYEEWLEILKEDGYSEAYDEFFSEENYPKLACRMFSSDLLKAMNDYDEFEMWLENTGIILEGEVILAMAMQEACELLVDEEAARIIVVRVEITEEDGTMMQYDEFYIDEDWEFDKFKK